MGKVEAVSIQFWNPHLLTGNSPYLSPRITPCPAVAAQRRPATEALASLPVQT